MNRYAAHARTIASSICLIVALCSIASAQTPYSLLAAPLSCFTDSNGVPLSGGQLFSYQAGSSTPLATYHLDTLGNITANQNPIILPSTGCAEVRLLPQAYKFVLQNSQGQQIFAVDQVEDLAQVLYAGAVLLNPIAGALQTIAGPISAVSLQLGGGTFLATTNQSGTGSLCMQVGCNLITPQINGIGMANGPGTYYVAGSGGTAVAGSLASLINGSAGNLIITPAGATGGIIGIVTAVGAGSDTVQQSGNINCPFDGAATAPDYVQASATTAGDCHDAGASYPTSGQVLGRVLDNIGSAGTTLINLFGPEIHGGGGTICASTTDTIVDGNTTATQVLTTCPLPNGSLNAAGKSFRLTASVGINLGGSYTSSVSFGMGTSSSLGNYNTILLQSSSADAWTMGTSIICTVVTSGSSGVLTCMQNSSTTNTGGSPVIDGIEWQMTGVNLTGAVSVGLACQFSNASSSNTCGEEPAVVEQLN
jgi:hypothetical protein